MIAVLASPFHNPGIGVVGTSPRCGLTFPTTSKGGCCSCLGVEILRSCIALQPREVVIKLPTHVKVGDDFFVLRIPVLEGLQRIFAVLKRRVHPAAGEKGMVGVSQAKDEFVLLQHFFVEKGLIRGVASVKAAGEEGLEVGGFNFAKRGGAFQAIGFCEDGRCLDVLVRKKMGMGGVHTDIVRFGFLLQSLDLPSSASLEM